MITARSDGSFGIKNKPFKVLICLVTLMAFLFNMVSYDIAWAVGTPSGLPVGGADRADGSEILKELHVDTFTLPEYLGHIKDSWSAVSTHRRGLSSDSGLARGESPQKVVIHIQDAHCNYYAQHKIAEIIEYLNKQYDVNTINLEGGAKDYDLAIFTDISDKAIRNKVSDYFVKEGLINGAEYFAINNPEKVALWGIEDTKLYLDNLNVYRESLTYKDKVDRHLGVLTHVLTNLKAKIYSQELLELDTKYSQYKAGAVGFKDYLGYLIQIAKQRAIDTKAFTNIYLLSQTLEREETVDFKKANKQRDDLIDKLQKNLSKKSLEELVLKAVGFRSEKISPKDFYSYLANKTASLGIELKEFPDLQKYIAYISMYDAIDKIKAMDEMENLESKIKETLYQNDEQKALNKLSKNLAVLKNIFDITLTRDDYKYYIDNEQSFDVANYASFIDKEAPLYHITAQLDKNITDLDGYRVNTSKFYEYSFKRDSVFLKNIRFAKNQKIAIVVTGGFHTENLCEKFKKDNISYISIMPSFSNYDGYACPYFGLLSGNKVGLQERFYPIFTSVSSIQIASMLSGAIAPEVWGKANIDAFRAAVLVQEQIARGRDIDNVTRVGDNVIFHMKNGETEQMSIRTLLDAVHQKDIDGQMEKLPESAFEDIANINSILDEVKTFLKSIGASQGVLDEVEALKGKNTDGRALVRLVHGATLEGHAGGQGIRINANLKGNDKELKAIIIHEVIAGLFGDHFLSEMVTEAFRANNLKSSVLARVPPLMTAIWNMRPEQRLMIGRDFVNIFQQSKIEKNLYIQPGQRKAGDGYVLSIDVPTEEKKYHLKEEMRAQDIDYLYETHGIIDEISSEMKETHKEVRRIADLLLDAAGVNPKNFIVHLFDTQEINAFVVPYSNHIFISVGIIKYLLDKDGSLDALAFLMAHEITHIIQHREDIDSGKVIDIKSIKDIGQTFIERYTDEYDADWRALKLLDKVYEKSDGKAGFSISQASFFFKMIDSDMEKERKRRDRFGELITKFGTHPQIKERIRGLENLMNSFYWRSYFKEPTNFPSDLVKETQSGTRKFNFRRDIAKMRALNDFKGLLTRVTSIGELEYLVIRAYELDKQGIAHLNFNDVFNLADHRVDELMADAPHLLPYYFFIFTSLGVYTGRLRLDYDKQKELVKENLKGLGFDELHRLLRTELPLILETESPPFIEDRYSDKGSEYFEYKYWFYGYKYYGDNRKQSGPMENFAEIWIDSVMETLEDRVEKNGVSLEQTFDLKAALEYQRQRFKQPRAKLISVWRNAFAGNRDIFHVYNNDIAWYLWKHIKADPVKNREYIPHLMNMLKVFVFHDPSGFGRGYRQSILLAPNSVRAKRFKEMSDGLKQLIDKGQISKSDFVKFLASKWKYKEDNVADEYLNRELQLYPKGDILDFSSGKILEDLRQFMLFVPGGVIFLSDGVKILKKLISCSQLSDAEKFEFLKNAMQIFAENFIKKQGGMKASLHFMSSMDEYLRDEILTAKQTPELQAFLTAEMVGIEKEKNITGLSKASFPMQKLIYLFYMGGGVHPWTLRHVLFGRDTDNAGKLFTVYKNFSEAGPLNPFEYEYSSDDYLDEDKDRMWGASGMKRIDQHPLYGLNFSNDDLSALYHALSILQESKNGLRNFPTMEEFDPTKETFKVISKVQTWEEYVAILGIVVFLRSQGIETTNAGLFPMVLDPGEYGQVPSYYKAFTGELFEVPPFEAIDYFAVRSSTRMAEKHRRYHNAPLQPNALVRQYFNDGPIDQMFEKAFGFVRNIKGTYEDKATYLTKALPPSVFRNFALYALFLNDVLQAELWKKSAKVSLDMKKALDPEYLQNIVSSEFSIQEQLQIMKKAEIIQKHIVWDKKLDACNRRGMAKIAAAAVGDKLQITDNPDVAEKSRKEREDETKGGHDKAAYVYISKGFDSSAFIPYQFYVPGGVEAHIEFILPHMFIPTIKSLLGDPNITFAEKMRYFEALYTRPSPIRDQHLDRLLESTKLSPDDIKKCTPLFTNAALAQKYCLKALELERDIDPKKFENPDYELERIIYYFPDFGYVRDDILNHFINMRVTHPIQLRKSQSFLLQFQDNVRQEDVRSRVFGYDILKSIFENYLFGSEKKKEFLLWVMGFSNKKPDFFIILENFYQVSFDGMRAAGIEDSKYYKNIGRCAFEDTLSLFLYGEKGVLSDKAVAEDFLNAIFDAVMSTSTSKDTKDFLRKIYLAVFDHASETRKEQILKRLFVAMKQLIVNEKLSPEEIEAKSISAFLESLGFVGVKLGQFLASANLSLPKHIADRLEYLKEKAPMLNKGIAFGALEIAFGDFYKTFEALEEPLGSASIKMVYRAKLKDGRHIVVKLKRPDVEKRIEEEMGLLIDVLESTQGYLAQHNIQLPKDMIQKIRSMIEEELDFDREVANQKTLKKNVESRTNIGGAFALLFNRFIKPSLFSINIPQSGEVRNNLVMTEELIEGVSLSNDAAVQSLGINPIEAKEAAAEELLKEIFIDGQYHADPHAGNILVDKNHRLSFIDLGLMGTLSEKSRAILLKLIIYMRKDVATKVPPIISKMLGIPNDQDVVDLLKNLNQGKPITIAIHEVQNAIADSDTDAWKLLSLLKLIEDKGGILPQEIIIFDKTLGTAGYLLNHLTTSGAARVIAQILYARAGRIEAAKQKIENNQPPDGINFGDKHGGATELERTQELAAPATPQPKSAPNGPSVNVVTNNLTGLGMQELVQWPIEQDRSKQGSDNTLTVFISDRKDSYDGSKFSSPDDLGKSNFSYELMVVDEGTGRIIYHTTLEADGKELDGWGTINYTYKAQIVRGRHLLIEQTSSHLDGERYYVLGMVDLEGWQGRGGSQREPGAQVLFRSGRAYSIYDQRYLVYIDYFHIFHIRDITEEDPAKEIKTRAKVREFKVEGKVLKVIFENDEEETISIQPTRMLTDSKTSPIILNNLTPIEVDQLRKEFPEVTNWEIFDNVELKKQGWNTATILDLLRLQRGMRRDYVDFLRRGFKRMDLDNPILYGKLLDEQMDFRVIHLKQGGCSMVRRPGRILEFEIPIIESASYYLDYVRSTLPHELAHQLIDPDCAPILEKNNNFMSNRNEIVMLDDAIIPNPSSLRADMVRVASLLTFVATTDMGFETTPEKPVEALISELLAEKLCDLWNHEDHKSKLREMLSSDRLSYGYTNGILQQVILEKIGLSDISSELNERMGASEIGVVTAEHRPKTSSIKHHRVKLQQYLSLLWDAVSYRETWQQLLKENHKSLNRFVEKSLKTNNEDLKVVINNLTGLGAQNVADQAVINEIKQAPATEGVSVEKQIPAIPATETFPDREIIISHRQAQIVEAFNATNRKADTVKVIVGIPVDMNRTDVQPTLSTINRGLAKNGFGSREDNKQVITFEIDVNNLAKTAQNQERAIQNAREGLSVDGRIVLFAPQMEKGPQLAGKAQETYEGEGNITVVPDAYSDSAPEKNIFPDIMVRVALGRNIAFYYTGKDIESTLAIIKDLLAKVADNDLTGVGDLNELLKKLNEIALRIRPIDYKVITDWQKSQEAVATAL